jgi:putative redox protein
VPPKPPTVVELIWTGNLEFAVRLKDTALVVDSRGLSGPSPVDALGAALASCMAADLAHILTKGRHDFTALRARLVAERASEDPHRFVSVTLHFTVEGPVPREAAERGIALSREKYCSVWHSLRQDIEFVVTVDVAA